MKADVCLILEGTWPYVAGGVSTWVAQILSAMPHLRFSVLYIGAKRSLPRELKYDIPANVVDLREVFIHDYHEAFRHGRGTPALTAADWEAVGDFQTAAERGAPLPLEALLPVTERLAATEKLVELLGRSEPAWDLILHQYRAQAPAGVSFLDYFWTHRFINIPALGLLRAPLPRARVYHTACTGYAGLLGAAAKARTGAPLLISEHGIYTRERRIEIFNAEWIQDTDNDFHIDVRRSRSYFKTWWTNFFLAMSRTAYDAAQQVVTLFEANRRIQLEDGADAERTHIIPNGIDLARYGAVPPATRTADEPLRIGFVGRVTAIKDIKTLLRSFSILRAREVPFEAWLLGPLDEEPEYVEACAEMTTALGLDDVVHTPGRVDVVTWLGRLDVIVLSSISEGLPFVLLEAMCAGRPCVSTDVGACRELLQGRTPEDKALGESGLIVPVASPERMASALSMLAESPDLCARMGAAGQARVRRFYDITVVMDEYRALYEGCIYAGVSA